MLLLCCVALPVSLLSQQAAQTVSYARTLWTVTDGLPEDTVQVLTESVEGSVYIGTTGGLAKTGGLKIRWHDIGLSKPLETNSVSALVPLKDSTMWIGTEGNGLFHLMNRRSRAYTAREGLTNGFVRALLLDSRGRLWVGTDKGLFLRNGNRVDAIGENEELSTIAVRSIAEDRDGRIWVGGSRLISIEPDGKTRRHPLALAGGEEAVQVVLQSLDHSLWIGTATGLLRLQGGRLHRYPAIHANIHALLETPEGTLWIGTIGDGLWKLQDGRFTRMLDPGLLPSETILSLLRDHFGQIWIGTRAGLVRLENSPVTFIPLPNAKDRGFETISGDRAGNLWVAAKELFHVQDGAVHQVTKDVAALNVRNIYRARDGALWVGTEGRGAYRMLDDKKQHYLAPAQLTNNSVRSFLESKEGEMWIATDEGVSVVRGSDVRKLTEASGLVYSSTRSLLEDRTGTIWIGTDRGLSAWKSGRFVTNAITQALAKERVWSMLEDRQGALWFGTREHGMYREHDGAMTHFTAEEGLPTNSIYKILQDRRGIFWLSGPNVIYSVQETEMDAPAASGAVLTPLIYALPSEGIQMYGGVEPAGYLAPDDTVSFPSNRGVAKVMVPQARPAAWAPGVVIFQLLDDGRVLPIRHKTGIPAEMLRVSFRLSALYLRPQETLRFRYRLDGFESKWTEARAETVATYTNLRPGHYRLLVQIVDLSSPGSIAESVWELDKAPFFYQTRTFYLCCVLVVIAIGCLIYRLRMRQMQLRFDAVLEERARLAREMHDTVIQGCTGISALLEAAEDAAESPRPEHRELLNHARDLTIATINQARQSVWAMRHGPEVDIDIVAAMHDLAQQTMSDHKTIHVRSEASGSLLLPTSIAHEVIMVMRESIYNAMQHSGSSELLLKIQWHREEVVLEITDYGCGLVSGLESSQGAGHYGIIGMRERLKRIGGTLELITSPGEGTTVRAVFTPMSSLKGAILV